MNMKEVYIRITTNKVKRLLLTLLMILLVELILTSMSSLEAVEPSTTNLTAIFLEENKDLEPIIQEETYYVSNHIEELLDIDSYAYVPFEDELERLMNKFNFRVDLREYFRSICELQNVDPIIALSLCRIESHCCNHEGYNKKSPERMYYTKGEATWDLGAMQMSTYYSDYWEEYFFNPELIFSLGYVRNDFNLEDDYISIQVGVSYLGHLYKRLGSYTLAIQAYNCGISNVLNNNIPDITYRYTHAIMNSWMFRESKEGDI